MIHPGDIVHVEHHEAKPTGGLYAVEAVAKRSGGYMARARALDGPNEGAVWFLRSKPGAGFKTAAGAVRSARLLADGMEDVTYREGFDILD